MSTHAFTVREAISYGWKTFKKNWQFLLITFAIVIVAGMVPNWLHDWSKEHMPAVSFIFSILSWVIQMITSIGIIVISLKFVDGKKPQFKDLYQHYPLFLNYFLASLLYGVVVIAGFILLIVPGIIWGIKYQFITYLVVDKGMSPMEAFKKSGHLTQGNRMKLFYLGLSFMGLTIVGILLAGVGLVIVWPIISLAGAYVYRKLSPKS